MHFTLIKKYLILIFKRIFIIPEDTLDNRKIYLIYGPNTWKSSSAHHGNFINNWALVLLGKVDQAACLAVNLVMCYTRKNSGNL